MVTFLRHRVKGKKLNRDEAARRALLRILAISLIKDGEITTTLPKAKFLRPFIEKLLTISRRGDLASHRLVIARLGNKPLVAKRLREHWAPKFKKVAGGYTRIVKLGPRQRDRTEMAKISFAVPKDLKKQAGSARNGKGTAKNREKIVKRKD